MEDKERKGEVIAVKLNLFISREQLEDIMAAALEGGITDWCGRVEIYLKGDNDRPDYASEVVPSGGVLRLYDAEDDEESWFLTKEKLLEGIQQWLPEKGKDFYDDCSIDEWQIDTGMIDAVEADTIIQYALFGEMVYS